MSGTRGRNSKGSKTLTRLGLLAVAASFSLVVSQVLMAPLAGATHVDPVLVDGNPTCGALEGEGQEWIELKVEPVQDGTYSDGTLEVTVDVYDTEDGQEFDWTANIGIDAVFAKGGSNGNLYAYDPPSEETSDSGLHAPENPSGDWAGLSHISFCYDTEPDLSIEKASSSAQVDELNTITFTITVENTGDATANDVEVNDNLWDRLTGVTGTYDGPGSNDGTCTVNPGNNHVNCEVGDLDPGEVVTVTIIATAPDLPLTEGGSCEKEFDNEAWVESNEIGPVTSNSVTVTVIGTGCETTTTTTTTPPEETTTTTTATVAPTTITTSDEVQPTTVEPTSPGGVAFTGVQNAVPLGALALTLLTTGTGLMWAGTRRRKDGPEDLS